MPIKTVEEIQAKLKDTKQQYDYLFNFLLTCYKGSDAKQKAERELIVIKNRIEILEWVENDQSLPF